MESILWIILVPDESRMSAKTGRFEGSMMELPSWITTISYWLEMSSKARSLKNEFWSHRWSLSLELDSIKFCMFSFVWSLAKWRKKPTLKLPAKIIRRNWMESRKQGTNHFDFPEIISDSSFLFFDWISFSSNVIPIKQPNQASDVNFLIY